MTTSLLSYNLRSVSLPVSCFASGVVLVSSYSYFDLKSFWSGPLADNDSNLSSLLKMLVPVFRRTDISIHPQKTSWAFLKENFSTKFDLQARFLVSAVLVTAVPSHNITCADTQALTTVLLVTVVQAVIGAVTAGPLRDAAVVCLAGELGFLVTPVIWTH